MHLPKLSKRTKYITLGVLLVILVRVAAVAQTTGNTFTMQEPSTMLNIYKKAAAGWTNSLFQVANSLFTLLLLVEFTYSAITNYLQHQELQSWMAAMLRKVLSLGAFYVLLVQGQTWIPAIIDSLQVVGQNQGGGALAPDTIVGHGFNITMILFSAANDRGFLMNPGTAFPMCFAALIVLFAYVFISIQFIIAKVESYILMSAGVIFLGFGGSRWTSSYTERFIGGAVASGIKLMVLYLVIALGDPLAQGWINQANTSSNLPDNSAFATAFSIATGAVIYMVICWASPKLISGLISGSPAMSGSDISGAAVFGASATVGAAAVTAGGASLLTKLTAKGGATGGSGAGAGVQSASEAAGSGTTFMGNAQAAPMMSSSAAPPPIFSASNGAGSSASMSSSHASAVPPPSSESAPSELGPSEPGPSDQPAGPGNPTPKTQSSTQSNSQSGSTSGPAGIARAATASASTGGFSPAPSSSSSPSSNTSPSEQASSVSTPPTQETPTDASQPAPSSTAASSATPANPDGSTSEGKEDDGKKQKTKLEHVQDFLDNTRSHINQSNLPHDGGGGGGASPNLNIKHDE